MTDTKNSVFLSHASADDALVRALQQRLQDLGQGVWIDSGVSTRPIAHWSN